MAEASFQERTEQATPKRRDDARKKGQVARSAELNSVAMIFFGLMALLFSSGWIYQHLAAIFISNIERIPNNELDILSVTQLFASNGLHFLGAILPLLVIMIVGGILINIAQVGVHFTSETITPKLDKLDIAKGFSRVFSKKTAVELIRDVIKIGIIGYISYLTIKDEMPNFMLLADQGIGQILYYGGALTLKLGFRLALALLFLAILDYTFQRYEFEKSIRMTKQEIKEEFREFEGDPQIKARVKRIQREMSRKRMLAEVEKADVVVTNPTHIAVALRYNLEKDSAPVVVAKGERLIAEKIKEVAQKFGIPVIENKPLARTLFELVDIGKQIPAQLYRAVAEILAFVYRQKGKS